MKKIFSVLLILVATLAPAHAENSLSEPDSIPVTYVPNSFKDNWELSVAGGPSFLFNFTHSKEMNEREYKSKFFNTIGGGGELVATKWFNPFVAARLGWFAEYLNFSEDSKSWNNYFHFDVLWDWTTQFGGVKPNRIYTFAPYAHMGVVYNPTCNAMVAGGVGFLNSFRLAEHWSINIDLRATATSARKFGADTGIGLELTPMVGFSYRFKETGWKTKVYNPSGDEIKSLRAKNDALNENLKKAQDENEDLAAKNAELAKRVAAAPEVIDNTKEVIKGVFVGLPDTLSLTVYYGINSYELSPAEKLHLNTYLALISMNDSKHQHKISVLGTADGETGPAAFNQQLAADRANSIKQALLDAGVKEEMIRVDSKVLTGTSALEARASKVTIYPL